jgi:hypothetical protein
MDKALLPRALGLLALTGQHRDGDRSGYERQHRVLEAALHSAVEDPALLRQIGAAAGRMGRDAGGG